MTQSLLQKFSSFQAKTDPESTTFPLVTNAFSHSFTQLADKTDDFQAIQFDKIYSHRYAKLREFYSNYAKNELNEELTEVYNLESEKMSSVLLCGTINRKMRQMESFVKEIQKPEFSELDYQRPKELSTSEDTVILEDATGKVELRDYRESVPEDSLRIHNLATGCVVLVQGHLGTDQKLQVSEIILVRSPKCLFEATKTVSQPKSSKKKFLSGQPKGRQFILLSGLKMTPSKADDRQYKLLKLFLKNQCFQGTEGGQTLVSFGGLSNVMEKVNLSLYYYHYYTENFINIQAQFIESIRLANELFKDFLNEATDQQTREVVLVPTINDPTFGGLPQPPFKKKLFEGVGNENTFFLLPNPAVIEVFHGREALVWDGVNVADFAAQAQLGFEEAAVAMVFMRLSAPTCPNTLETFALDNCDSLIMETVPNYVIVGNSPRFSTRKIESIECTLVFVPDFSNSGELVIFDAQNDTFETVIVK